MKYEANSRPSPRRFNEKDPYAPNILSTYRHASAVSRGAINAPMRSSENDESKYLNWIFWVLLRVCRFILLRLKVIRTSSWQIFYTFLYFQPSLGCEKKKKKRDWDGTSRSQTKRFFGSLYKIQYYLFHSKIQIYSCQRFFVLGRKHHGLWQIK